MPSLSAFIPSAGSILPRRPRLLHRPLHLSPLHSLPPSAPPLPLTAPTMLQSPSSDGPPPLDAFFDRTLRSAGTTGPPIALSTSRLQLPSDVAAVPSAVQNAISVASASLPAPAQLVHATLSPSLDLRLVASVLSDALPSASLIARTVSKHHSHPVLELLLLTTAAAPGIVVSSFSVSSDDPIPADPDLALENIAATAAADALSRLAHPPTFLVFAHAGPASDAAARRGLTSVFPPGLAYGGPARGTPCALAGGPPGDAKGVTYSTGEPDAGMRILVAAVPGSLAFLASAVVKNWAQPVYTEKMPYMTPRYVGEAAIDLLTAIRYDDWDKFVWCLGEGGVDVNTRWTAKQNQIPLLAACARARTTMIKYLLERGADVNHRNDGGFTAAMYTRMLTEYDPDLIREQLRMLEDAGADVKLTEEEAGMLKRATSGKIVE